jgi:hypothetical protein
MTALALASVAALAVGLSTASAGGGDYPPSKVFVCKYVGKPGVDETLQTGQNPISVSINSIQDFPGVGGSFADAQGRSLVIAFDTGQAEPSCPDGQGCPEGQDCTPPPFDQCPDIPGNQPEGTDCNPPVDFCPTLPGVQAEDEDCPLGIPVVAGVSFTEPTCDTLAAFILTKTFPGLRFYNVEGPDLVDGHPVPGGTYTLTALVDEGFLLEGDGVFVHTFAAAPTNCGTPPPPGTPVGDATVICLMPAAIYQLSGKVDGQTADSVTPATLPGTTKGVTNVVVTRGDTSVRTTVSTNGDCVPPPTPGAIAVTPAAVTTPTPTTTPPAAKPVVKPKPKPVRKPAAKPKPKPKAKAKPKPPKKAPQHPPHTLGLGL